MTACMQKNFSFLKENSLLKLITKVNDVAIPAEQTVTYQERSQSNKMGLEAQADLAEFYTHFNQAMLKDNFWISLFVQCSWMRNLVHVLSNLKADLSH